MASTAAVVITTYNNPAYLGICLKSLSNQTSRDFDIFIADDGSGDETKVKIESLRDIVGRPMAHFWHPDTGYNKSRINNEVFRSLRPYPIVICMDHDVIAHRKFVEDHLMAHRQKTRACFMGRRVELGPGITSKIHEGNVLDFNGGPTAPFLWSALTGDTRNGFRGIRIANPWIRKLLRRDLVPDLLGSNFSLSTELLFEVNGYNEDYQAYWGEDGDLFVRMRNAGARFLGSKSLAIQFHLDHPRLEPSHEHQERYRQILKDPSYRRCERGIERP